MCRVTEQKSSAFPEMLRHAVMHVVGRKPVHILDPELEMLDRSRAHTIELKSFRVFGTLVSHGPNQAGPALAGERKNSEKSASSRST